MSNKNYKNFLKSPGIFAGAFIVLLLVNMVIISNVFIPKPKAESGTIAGETIKAPRTINFKSQIKTKEAQDKAIQKVEKVYKFDPSIEAQQKGKLESVFSKIDEIKNQELDDKASLVLGALSLNISLESAAVIADFSSDEWQMVKEEIFKIINSIQENDKIKNDEPISSNIVDTKISNSFSPATVSVIKEIIPVLLLSNYIYSEEDTEKKKEEIKEDVEPVLLVLGKDEVIVRAGEIIDDLELEKLDAAGLKKQELFDPKTIGIVIISSILIFISALYFYFFYNPSFSMPVSRPKAFFIYSFFLIISILAFQILTPLKPIMAYIIPIAAPVALISILISAETAIFSAIIISLFLGIVIGNSVELTTIYIVTSLVGIYKLKSVNKIEDIFKAGLYLGLFNFIIATSFHLIAGSFSARTVSVLLGAASIYGLGAVVLIVGSLLFWGNIFKITTLLELLELENPNQPILKELALKSPGTYHHSVLVSNLAERAAFDIECNALLARVGSIYHDIGKISNANYFIENQRKYNIHEKIKDPEKSAKIIKSHVEEGVILGKKEKFPKEIIHIIESHHGTSRIFYFLNKAVEDNNKEIDYAKFSYDGPLPKTKEAALVMLADGVEAKVRATDNISPEVIKDIINEIVDEKLNSNQLISSDLSLRDIENIKISFAKTLATMFHKRIKYHKDEK